MAMCWDPGMASGQARISPSPARLERLDVETMAAQRAIISRLLHFNIDQFFFLKIDLDSLLLFLGLDFLDLAFSGYCHH